MRDPPVHEPPPQSLSPSGFGTQIDPPSPRLVPSDLSSPLAPTAPPQQEDSEFVGGRRRAWAKLIAQVWLEDPSLCACCHKPMKIVAAISSPHHDDVIERILRHLNLWDPPWLRQRKARGPPHSTGPPGLWSRESEPPRSIDPVVDDQLYVVDPPFDSPT